MRFLGRLLICSPRALLRCDLIVQQVYNSGTLSLIIIMLSGLFVGMVLGLQGFQLLQRFGSEEALGTAATIGLVKELGPVITALLFAGRAGTSLASELGLMRATDSWGCRSWVSTREASGRRCAPGYHATPTAEGVGRATTRTVVTSAVVILFFDYLLTTVFL